MPGVRGVAVVDPDEPRRELKKPAHWANTKAQSGIAVIAEHYWQARKALEALPVTWDFGPGAQWKTTQQIYDALYARLKEPAEDLLSDVGDAPRSSDAADANSRRSHLPHAVLRSRHHGAAQWHRAGHRRTASTCGIRPPWCCRRWSSPAKKPACPPENIHLHQTLVGGSFGRRVNCDDVRMVVAVARKFPGTPIHVIWSREETFRQGKYRDLHAARMRAALGADGLAGGARSRTWPRGSR